jgi:hexosaminidase
MKLSILAAVLAALAVTGAIPTHVGDSKLSRGLPVLSTRTKPPSAETTPFVIPSLQHWEGHGGQWTLTDGARIVVDEAYANSIPADAQYTFMNNPSSLKDFADSFRSDLKAAVGKKLEVVLGNKSSCKGKDIFLTVCADQNLNNEGYTLDVSDQGVVIQGATARGAFWGTRSLLQISILEDCVIPKGRARDFPNYNERKFMQDLARKPIPMSDLQEYAQLASFFKMNTLHHHYNDNPGMRTKDLMPDWPEKYAGFRLRSPEYPWTMYASNDTSYTREDLRAFQDYIKPRGLDLIPEIDTPAHSLCFTKFHPEWSIQNDTARGDWLDLSNPEVLPFVERMWDEFVPFFDSREISIGADEYSPDKGELVRQYVNHFHDYFATHYNRTIRMWGSDVRLPGTTEINSNIHTDHWDWSYSDPVSLVRRGHKVSNLNAPDVYLVPRSGSYWDYINNKHIYDLWEPWVFDTLDRENKSRNLDPNEPLLTGGGFANWNDFMGESVTRVELFDRVSHAMGVFAEKLWAGANDMPYEDWELKMKKLLNAAPGITLGRRPESKDQFVLSYDFEDGAAQDASENGYDGQLESVSIVEDDSGHGKVAQLSASSYISTPLDGLAYPYTVGMWVKPIGNQTAEAVLLESGDSRILISNKTSPTVTFEQDHFQYSTNVILPADVWSHLAVVADGRSTYVYYNMRRVGSVNWFNPRWDQLRNETMVLTVPLATIGSKAGNSVNALVDGVVALNRQSVGGEISFLAKHYSNSLP